MWLFETCTTNDEVVSCIIVLAEILDYFLFNAKIPKAVCFIWLRCSLGCFLLKKMHSKGAFILCIVITWHSKPRFAF